MSLNPVSRRVLIRKIKALGYEGPFPGTRHEYMLLGVKKVYLPNPHGNQDIGVTLLRIIIRQLEITVQEFIDLS